MVYARPVLCRLCGFPALDGGVPVSEVDREKLSEWCLRMMDTELDQEGLEKAVFCQFCVLDARVEHQISLETGDVHVHSGWWKSGNVMIMDKFYLGDEIQPCFVKLESLPSNQIEELPVTKSGLKTGQSKVYKCLFCPLEFLFKSKRKNHITETHRDKPIFKCRICKAIFKSKVHRRAHIEKAHRDKYLCIYCGANYKQRLQYKIHMLKWHKKEAIQCNYNQNCTIYFKTEAERKEHVHKVHESGAKKTQCVYCKKFTSISDLSSHMRWKHRLEAIRCDLIKCSTYFLSREEKETHFEQVHRSKREFVECIYCRKEVQRRIGLFQHIKKYHKTEAIKCNFNTMCPTYFLTEEDRQQHIRDVHEAKFLTKVQCIYCQQFYTDYRSLFGHVKYKHSKVMIKCKWLGCQQYFLSDLEHDEHFRQMHEANDKKNLIQCQKCCYKTKEMRLLNNHVLLHHSFQNSQCSLCPMVFQSKFFLMSHMRQVHTPRPKLECRVCLVKFKSLSFHLRKKKCPNCDFVSKCSTENVQHSKICAKKLKCKFCEEAFKTNKLRNTHTMKQHVAPSRRIENYCYLCSRKFITAELLELHKKGSIHQKNIRNAPFTCNFCQKQYPSLKKILDHIKAIHLENSDFPCPQCARHFTRKLLLTTHFNYAHSADTKFVNCDMCNVSVRDTKLKRHKFTVHQIL